MTQVSVSEMLARLTMKRLRSILVVFVYVSCVCGLAIFGGKSKKPASYRPTYCITLPFSEKCQPIPPLWYYKPEQKTCVATNEGYCIEGFSKFVSLSKCLQMCDPRSKIMLKECLKPPSLVRCAIPKYAWYYDKATDSCKMFTFYSCESNGNYFASELKCQSVCKPKKKPATLCSADPIPDTCFVSRKHFYFSFRNNACVSFPKNGCGKGTNSFVSLEKCINACSYNQSTAACPKCGQIPQNELPPKGISAAQTPQGPVVPAIPVGPPTPHNAPVPQSKPSANLPPGNPALPSAPVPGAKPSANLPPGSPALPIARVPEAKPISNNQSNPALPASPTKPGQLIPTAQLTSSMQSNQQAPTVKTNGPVTPLKPSNIKKTEPAIPTGPSGQGSQTTSGSSSPPLPVPTTNANQSKRAAYPLRAGFHSG